LSGSPKLADDGIRLTATQLRQRRSRSIGIAVALAATVAFFYVVTIAKIGANILDRAL
jgi:hypothetical protein